jgi:PEP-CTERM motif-containing protein
MGMLGIDRQHGRRKAAEGFVFSDGTTTDSSNSGLLLSTSVDVPEPASLLLLAGGLMGVATLRRRFAKPVL